MKKAFDTVLEIEPEPVIDRTDDDYDDYDDEDRNCVNKQMIMTMTIETASISIFEYLSDIDQNKVLSKLRMVGLLSVWGRCVCHLIQLAVKDFIQTNFGSHGSVNKIIGRANLFVKSARKSVQCTEIFLEHKFRLDSMNQTRWDSMFTMIQSLLHAEAKGLLRFLTPLEHRIPKNYELSILREVEDVLEPIHLFTLEFQNSLGTSGMVIPGLQALYHQLDSIDIEEGSMAQTMLRIVRGRFSEVIQDNFMIIGNCIDPRFSIAALCKQDFLEILKKAMIIVIRHDRNVNTTTIPSRKRSNSLCKRKSLFDYHPANEVVDSYNTDYDVIENELLIFRSEARIVNQIIGTDPVNWWRQHQHRMPFLFKLSELYLLPTPSIAENERVFSIAGRICRPHRANLDLSTLVMLVTLKHRLKCSKLADKA